MRVIARGYGDEPLDRETAGVDEGVVFIVNPKVNHPVDKAGDSGVGFPAGCVFDYSEPLWRSLSDAWARGDVLELESLWSRTPPFSAMADA